MLPPERVVLDGVHHDVFKVHMVDDVLDGAAAVWSLLAPQGEVVGRVVLLQEDVAVDIHEAWPMEASDGLRCRSFRGGTRATMSAMSASKRSSETA